VIIRCDRRKVTLTCTVNRGAKPRGRQLLSAEAHQGQVNPKLDPLILPRHRERREHSASLRLCSGRF
jgi:hypothetical protein